MPLSYPLLVCPIILSNVKLDVVPATTGIETVDTYTIPAGTFAVDGDAVEIEWLFQQTVANNSMITIECPTGVGLLADTRNVICDRLVIVRFERVTSTSLRRQVRYLYSTGAIYNPAIAANIADATAAIINRARLTNSVAAGDCRAISRRVIKYPVVN